MTDFDGAIRAESEAVFGSSARGDFDRLSDRDILIVDADIEVLRVRRHELERSGWSVASYTFRKLEALATMGSLFVQHLKTEADIIHDLGGRLVTTLNAFRPKASYTDELRANAALSSLIKTRPSSSQGNLWAADVLYVAVRNFGVLYLAERGISKFSYSGIIDQLVSLDLVSIDATVPLVCLREAKSIYRLGGEQPVNLSKTINAALTMLPPAYFPRLSDPIEHGAVVTETLNAPANPSSYIMLRQLEKCLVSASHFDPQLSTTEPFIQLRHIVEDPRAYAGQISILAPRVLRALTAHTMAQPMTRRLAGESAPRPCGIRPVSLADIRNVR
jgi:hypothetical protein